MGRDVTEPPDLSPSSQASPSYSTVGCPVATLALIVAVNNAWIGEPAAENCGMSRQIDE